jgi:glycosyltransferase involved in cell wall biosynthesis
MKVSIITVTYNSARYLQECIDSVYEQEYEEIEHIIVDGNSIDNTLEIINRNITKISNYVSEPDSGIYEAINKGIKMATGDIVGILNSDDTFTDRSVVRRIVDGFANSIEIVFANVDFISSKTGKIVRHYSSKQFSPWMFRFGFMPAHPSFYSYRRNFEKYGFYRVDMKISGDFELLLRYLNINKLSYKYFDDTWVNMRIGGVSTSGYKSITLLNREIEKACKINGIYTNSLLIYSKYIIKWKSFIIKKKN